MKNGFCELKRWIIELCFIGLYWHSKHILQKYQICHSRQLTVCLVNKARRKWHKVGTNHLHYLLDFNFFFLFVFNFFVFLAILASSAMFSVLILAYFYPFPSKCSKEGTDSIRWGLIVSAFSVKLKLCLMISPQRNF